MLKLRTFTKSLGLVALLATLTYLSGCERKEKIVDIETPRGEVEVERSLDTGEVDVEVDGNN